MLLRPQIGCYPDYPVHIADEIAFCGQGAVRQAMFQIARQGGRFASLSFNHDANEARDEFGAFKVNGTDALVAVPAGPVGASAVAASTPPSVTAKQDGAPEGTPAGVRPLSML